MTHAPESVGKHLHDALAARDIPSRQDGHASAGASWLAINLPGGTEIWIADPDASIDHRPSQHTGLMAIHYLTDPYGDPGNSITVYDSIHDPGRHGEGAFQADITALADALATYLESWPEPARARRPCADLPACAARRVGSGQT